MSNSDPVALPGDPQTTDFWEERYRANVAPWDLGAASPAFADLLQSPGAPPPGKMIVLGCGRGHDAILFAKHEFTVTAVDFAPSAIRDAEMLAREAMAEIRFVQHDMFTLGEQYSAAFDYVLEHTCFAAIPPKRRGEYAAVVSRLLRPGGLYIAVFFAHGRWGGPPFTTYPEELRTLFADAFEIEQLGPSPHSVPERQRQELYSLMRKRAANS